MYASRILTCGQEIKFSPTFRRIPLIPTTFRLSCGDFQAHIALHCAALGMTVSGRNSFRHIVAYEDASHA
jgi:hypothetical protein